MAIAPEAIERYLTAPLPHVPEFKGVSPDILRQRIIDVTGRPLASKTEPRYYQLEGVAFALYLRQSLLFFWMRLGKTKTAIDWANQLIVCDIVRGKGLVVAHSPQGAEVWESEIPKHSDLRAQVVHAGPELGERFIAALESDCHIIVAAHSVLQILFAEKKVMPRKGVPKLYPDHEAIALAAEYFSFGIIDEIHLVANPEGLRFQICKGLLVNCRYRLGLTGTPVGRVAYPVWAIAALIDDGRTFGKSYHFFEYAFGKQVKAFFGKRKTQIIFDKKKLPALKQKLDTISLSYGKGEVKAAEVFAETIELRMGPKQKAAYNALLEKAVKERDEPDEAASANFFIKLRQVASGYQTFFDERGIRQIIHYPDSAKLLWLRELFAEISDDVQVIIFHEYVHSGELICKELVQAKKSHAWLHGSTPDKKRTRERFTSGEAQFLVANTATGGTAIDLPMADYLVFFESPCSPRVREQAAARPMARGDRPLMLDDLICAPVERNILGFIREGRDLSRQLLGSRAKLLKDFFDK